MADCDLHALEAVTDRTSMNSMITIVDTDDEVIELDQSQDDVVLVDDNGESKDVEAFESRETDLPPSDVIGDRKFIEKTPNVDENSEPYEHVESSDNSRPMFKVIFQNENVARQYEKEIREFLQSLVLKTSQRTTDSTFSDVILEIWDKEESCSSQVLDVSTESEDSQDLPLFTIDTQPTSKSVVDIPTYGKKYKDIIDKDKAEIENKEKDYCSPRVSCFNCLGNHNLRDCKEPRNRANIYKNRKELNVKGNPKTLRYHLDDDQKFGHMIPGQISKDLRNALGLKDNELPKHIYRMRVLGYPPGWLEEARLQHSGLSLFNSDGVAVLDPSDEPGEIVMEGDRDQYDIKKIFDFPGFNVPIPLGTHDDYKHYWTPQMQAAYSKENMLLQLRGKKTVEGYKREKLKLPVPITNDASTAPTDMDIEDLTGTENLVESVPINGHFIPPLPKDSSIKPPEPPTTLLPSERLFDCQSQDSADGSASPLSRANSPSLSDLESMKKQLLVELEDSSSQSNLETPVKSNSSNPATKTEVLSRSIVSTPQADPTEDTQQKTSQGNIKSVDLGTPVLQSKSPYNKLPSSEKFSKDICDVINFENLPDSTGKYEQMTGVLQKVRSALAKLHQDS